MLQFAIPCLLGLESLVGDEVKKLGLADVRVENGRVLCRGEERDLARLNINLRCGARVLLVLASFRATDFETLFQGTRAVRWEDWIPREGEFPVTGYSINSTLHSVPACQSIIKKAAVDRLASVYHLNYFEETGSVHQIQFNILKDTVTVYLDTSGAGLHKRGYRRNSNAAPIKETLAAGIVDLAMVKRNTIFCDPFCGSGTFLIEAAYKALNIAPGLKRTFAAEKWDVIPQDIWREERVRAMDSIIRDSDFFAYGYDIDPECVQLSIDNCAKAGVKKRIRIERADIRDYDNKDGEITVCNPPYGERMLEIKEAEKLYTEMGKVFKADKEHPCAIISPHEDFEKFFGKTANKRRKLYNGMIKCNLYSYYK